MIFENLTSKSEVTLFHLGQFMIKPHTNLPNLFIIFNNYSFQITCVEDGKPNFKLDNNMVLWLNKKEFALFLNRLLKGKYHNMCTCT